MRLKSLISSLVFIGFIFTLIFSCKRGNRAEKEKAETEIQEKVGALPGNFLSPKDNPTTSAKVELGRLLFYDPILSGKKDIACATCHHPEYGYAEGTEVSIGVNGVGLGEVREFNYPNDIPFTKRNAHTVLNTAFNGIDTEGKYVPERAPMFWDLRSESLEKQALEPIKSFEEMRGHAYDSALALDSVVTRLKKVAGYQELFSKVFNEENAVTITNLGKALAAFQRSLVANNSRFDRYMRGDESAMSQMEKEGYEAFLKTGCAKCHNGPMFSDFKLHILGVPDNEKLAQTDPGVNNSYAFRTPTLRNLRYTDPYMHSGKLQSLEDVLEFYEDMASKDPRDPHVTREKLDPLARNMNVNFKDFRLIIEFLNALNDDNFDKKIPEKVPSGLKVGGNIN